MEELRRVPGNAGDPGGSVTGSHPLRVHHGITVLEQAHLLLGPSHRSRWRDGLSVSLLTQAHVHLLSPKVDSGDSAVVRVLSSTRPLSLRPHPEGTGTRGTPGDTVPLHPSEPSSAGPELGLSPAFLRVKEGVPLYPGGTFHRCGWSGSSPESG